MGITTSYTRGRDCGLELTGIPDPVTGSQQGGWKPRVFYCELRKQLAATEADARKAAAASDSGRVPRMLSKAHPSHKVRVLGGLVYCCRCGGYAEKRMTKLLTTDCRGHAAAGSKTLDLLNQGLHPISGEGLGEVAE